MGAFLWRVRAMLRRLVPFVSAGAAVVAALFFGLSWAGIFFPDTPSEKVRWMSVFFVTAFGFAAVTFVQLLLRIRSLEDRLKPKAELVFNPNDTDNHVRVGHLKGEGGAQET